MTNVNKFLNISSDCKLVNGAKRGLLVDSHRGDHLLIPNSLIEFIKYADKKKLKTIYNRYKSQTETINEYIKFLEEKELLFWLDSKKETTWFPEKSLNWDYPATISNSIVSLTQPYEIDKVIKIINKLEKFGCNNILIKFETEVDITVFKQILELFNETIIEYIHISLESNNKELITAVESYSKTDNRRINQIIVFNCTIFKDGYFFDEKYRRAIIFTPKPLSNLNCGIVKTSYFNSIHQFFSESQQFNTCLNRKLSIDTDGNIQNCPSMAKSYGNINDPNIDIEAIVNSEEFQKVWHINKDKIHVCKDCEFRHVCTDCRAYVEDPSDIYSKPLKCGYNPYTCEWEEWSTHPMKHKAIDYYGMRNIINS